MRVALAQINTTVGDVAGNAKKAAAAAERAADHGADLVAFPELTIPGYPPEDLLLRHAFIRENLEALEEFARGVPEGVTAVVGFVDLDGDLYNSCAVVSGGGILYRYHKHYLPNYGVFDENRYFREGEDNALFKVDDALIGVSVCEDVWYPGGPAREQALGGARVLLNVSASPYHRLKGDFRERMLGVRASDNGCHVLVCNLVGGQDELVFDGRSAVFDPEGQVIARARQFEEDVLVADLHPEEALTRRLHDSRPRKEGSGRELEVIGASGEGKAGKPLEPRVEAPLPEEDEVLGALVTGLRDYFAKNGFSRAVLGLSGGIDSSLGTALAVRALGVENVTGVVMPSPYSSEGSVRDAKALAGNLGIELMEIPIAETFDAYRDTLSGAFEGLPEGVAEENLQARIRGNILMALSNKFGWIVLSTGNKSEMSVGYSTLYGDMAGGFSVIKDVPKTLVYRIARRLNELEERETIPDSVLTKEPSAELRPDQRDVDSLPPYEVLDPILEAYVEEDRGIEEISDMGFPREEVRRVVRMVDGAEYKRRQAPVGIKVTGRAFGRDRRMPITNRFSEEEGREK